MPIAWIYGLAGGVMIGLAAAVLFWVNGRIAGVSGIANGAFTQTGGERRWRGAWILALVAGGALAIVLGGGVDFVPRSGFPVWMIAAGGLLVGFGTRIGSGCTSGHGVCGIARLSPRSMAATAVFMATGAATVFVVRHLFGVM